MRGDGPGLLVPGATFRGLTCPSLILWRPIHGGASQSARLPTQHPTTRVQQYSGDLLVNDLLAVCDRLGLEAFSVLGYSLTAAIAGWLGSASPRVQALVLGGFPLLGSYEAV